MTTAAAVENDYSDHVMLCLRPPEDVRKVFASMDECTEDVDELHLTLFYLGTIEDLGGEWAKDRLYRACYAMAISGAEPLTGKVNGFGVFMNDQDTLVALWDIPYVAEFRAALGAHCRAHGVVMPTENHGFTPHMSLSHDDDALRTIPEVPAEGGHQETFDSIWMVWGEEWTEINLLPLSQ